MLCHAAAQTTDVSVAITRIYHWRHEVFRRHVARAKRILITFVRINIIKFIKIENYCIYCLEKGNTYTSLKIGLV